MEAPNSPVSPAIPANAHNQKGGVGAGSVDSKVARQRTQIGSGEVHEDAFARSDARRRKEKVAQGDAVSGRGGERLGGVEGRLARGEGGVRRGERDRRQTTVAAPEQMLLHSFQMPLDLRVAHPLYISDRQPAAPPLARSPRLPLHVSPRAAAHGRKGRANRKASAAAVDTTAAAREEGPRPLTGSTECVRVYMRVWLLQRVQSVRR